VAKNKGKYHSKSGADQPPVEQFQSFTSRAYYFLRPHAIKLAAVIGGVAVVLIAFSVYTWWDGKREAEATRLFGEVTRILEARIEPPKPEPAAPAPESDKDAKLTYATLKERGEAALGVLDRIERDYGSTDVAEQAMLVKAGQLLDLGRFDEAAAAYQRVIDKNGALRFLAAEGLGYALEAKGDLDGALAAFVKLQPDEKGFYRDQSLYHQARILAKKGDKAGALTLYKQILEKWPQSSLKTDVTNRVASLEAG
jgi:tetratricopeptide (TPR) repeat protein